MTHDPTTTTWVTTARCRHRHRESDSLLLGDHCALQAPRKATRSFCCCHNRRTKHRKWRTRMVATGTGMRVLPPPAPPPSPSAAASPPLSAASYRRCLFLLPPLSPAAPSGAPACRRHLCWEKEAVRSAFCDQGSKQRVPASSKFSFFSSRFVPWGGERCRRQKYIAEAKILMEERHEKGIL